MTARHVLIVDFHDGDVRQDDIRLMFGFHMMLEFIAPGTLELAQGTRERLVPRMRQNVAVNVPSVFHRILTDEAEVVTICVSVYEAIVTVVRDVV